MSRAARALSLTLLLLLLLVPGISSAGGGQAYTNGSEDFRVGLLPPPGIHYVHYANFFDSDDLKDNDGNAINGADDTTTFANTLRFLWITDLEILGGNYATHLFIPIVYTDVGGQDKVGLGNIIFTPFLMGWRGDSFHFWVNFADIFAPTRTDYSKRDRANLGNNFWTIEPIVAFSWLPTISSVPGYFEVTSKFMYDFNTKDRDHIVTADEAQKLGSPSLAGREKTRLPGQEFHFDYVLGYHPNEDWEVGAVGYFYHQTTDDEISGDNVDSRLGRVFAIGPGVKYNFERLSLIGKVYFETLAKNRYEGVSAFIKLNYAF